MGIRPPRLSGRRQAASRGIAPAGSAEGPAVGYARGGRMARWQTRLLSGGCGSSGGAGAALAAGLLAGVVLGVPCALLGPELLGRMGAAPATVAEGGGYARLLLGANVVVMLIHLGNGVFRGAGDAVAEGRFTAAWELPRQRRRTKRSMAGPEERFAALAAAGRPPGRAGGAPAPRAPPPPAPPPPAPPRPPAPGWCARGAAAAPCPAAGRPGRPVGGQFADGAGGARHPHPGRPAAARADPLGGVDHPARRPAQLVSRPARHRDASSPATHRATRAQGRGTCGGRCD